MTEHAATDPALANADLRQRVLDWKSRFFAANLARYYLAKPGSFHLVPPEFRIAESERDYGEMRPTFLKEPPPFASFEGIVGPGRENQPGSMSFSEFGTSSALALKSDAFCPQE